jgi:hypothetical protein
MHWHKNLLNNLLKQMAIERVQINRNVNASPMNKNPTADTKPCYISEEISTVITEDLESDGKVDDGADQTLQQKVSGKMAHRYKNAQLLLSDYEKRKPLSVVHLRDGRFGCLLRDNTIVIMTCDNFVLSRAGACYHNWALLQQTREKITTLEQIKNYCLLLPKMTPTGMPTSTNTPTYT